MPKHRGGVSSKVGLPIYGWVSTPCNLKEKLGA